MNNKKLQEARKKLAIDLRHHSDEAFEEETLLSQDAESLRVAEEGGPLSIFATKPGMFIIGSVAVFFALNFIIDLI